MRSISNFVALVKSVDRKIWPTHRVVITPEVAKLLGNNKLVVADVGSADGPQESWFNVKEFIHFLTFEPNPRPAPPGSEPKGTTNFPIGLWSKQGRKELYITDHIDSSSLLPINTGLFKDFLHGEVMHVVDSTMIDLAALDELLAGKPQLLPDFLKIDVEGADLEVLKGADLALAQSVMGLRVETSYMELHLGAPRISDIDAFLRGRGFVLFHLGSNHWVRMNSLHGFNSAPQLVWGDAIYFLTRERLLERLSQHGAEHRKVMLGKFIVMLLCHGIHDYSWEVIEAASKAGLVSVEFAGNLKQMVRRSMDVSAWYFVKTFLGVGFALSVLLLSLPLPGARKRGLFYLKQRAGRFFYDLWRLAARERHGHQLCIHDSSV